jgi:hypothetical protein
MARPPSIPPLVPPGSTFVFGESPFHAKGVLYLGTQTFFEANLQGGFAAFTIDIKEPELAAFIGQKFLPSSWYDVMPVPALIAYEARALRMTLEQYLLHRTRWQAKKDLGGIYGWVLKLASPGAVFTRLPKVFVQMFDFATVQMDVRDAGSGRGSIRGIPEPLRPWLTTALGVYVDTALKLAGAHTIDATITPVGEGVRAGVPIIRIDLEVSWR